ncbi:MAG TPA: hypothetical protein ENJ29_07005 [Bacteroidetes bacterium]|nr:hypothetical protein [Bacteroidota bacterium]
MKRVGKLPMFAALAVLVLSAGCRQAGGPDIPAEKAREFADALHAKALFPQSIVEYEHYLRSYRLDEEEQANVSYIIANTYFEQLHRYDDALAWYMRIKELYPNSTLADQADKRIVESLERLQRNVDAQQAREEATFIDPAKVRKKRPGVVVARIGEREITSGDLEYSIKQYFITLPPYILSQIEDKTDRLAMLKGVIATELLYSSARRKGLDRDPEILEGAFQAKKALMVHKLLQQELSTNLSLTDEDLRNYFREHIDRYTTGDSLAVVPRFEDVRGRVTQDFIVSQQKSAYERLLQRLMRAQAVKIYEDKLK